MLFVYVPSPPDRWGQLPLHLSRDGSHLQPVSLLMLRDYSFSVILVLLRRFKILWAWDYEIEYLWKVNVGIYLNGKLDVNGFVSLNFKLHFIIFIQNVKSQLHNGSFCFLIYPRTCTLTRKGQQIHFNTQVPGSVYKYNVTDWTTSLTEVKLLCNPWDTCVDVDYRTPNQITVPDGKFC